MSKNVKSKWVASVMKKPSFKKKSTPRIKGGIPHQRELKFVDIASADYVDAVTLLNGIATGDDYNTRDGRQATMRSVAVKGYLTPTANIAASDARLLLVWDNAPNGAAPVYADIMQEAGVPHSFPNINNEKRFTILKDWFQQVGYFSALSTSSYAQESSVHKIDLSVSLNSLTQFSGTGATVASIQNGAIWMVTEIGAAVKFVLSTRVRFTEP